MIDKPIKQLTIEGARSALLDFVADATRFDSDPDESGVQYHITVNHHTLEQLAEAVGITHRYDEEILDALYRAINNE